MPDGDIEIYDEEANIPFLLDVLMEKASMLQQVQTISFLTPSGICGLTVVTERRTNHSSAKNHRPHGGKSYHDTQSERARAELDTQRINVRRPKI